MSVQQGSAFTIRLTVTSDGSTDISGATGMSITVRKPSLGTMTSTATFVDDGTDGQVDADFTAAENSETGKHVAQFVCTLDGAVRKSELVAFEVKESL